jgi:transcription elongation factor GreB
MAFAEDEGAGGAPRYITAEGFRRLQEELEGLWKLERPRVTREVAAAAALGDRSENAEYLYGKRRLREIDRRIRFLSKRLDELRVVVPTPDPAGRAYFGAWVSVEDAEGTRASYQIVGPDESDPAAGRISLESPLGRALLGREAGDEVVVERPRGRATLAVLAVRYDGEPRDR